MEKRVLAEDAAGGFIYPVLNAFFEAYLSERNVEKTLSFVADDIYSLGTGDGEAAVNKEQFERLLRMEKEVIPESIQFRILDYHEKQTGSDVWQCFSRMETAVSREFEEPIFYKTRLTASFRKINGRYLAESLHMSEASSSHESGEFFPLRFMSEQAEKLNRFAQKELLDILCGIMPGGIIGGYMEEGFPLYVVNDTLLDMMGYTYEEFVERIDGMMLNSIHKEDVDRVRKQVLKRMEEGREYAIEYRVMKKDESYFWVYDIGRKVVADDGRIAVISVLIDVSNDVQNRMKLKEESATDFLTGVYNRKGGEALISQKMQTTMPYVFFMMDLDNFKRVNDLYGHGEGDNMLRYVAQMLKNSFWERDVVLRVGGDEFAVLAYPCTDVYAIKKKVEEIIRKCCEEADKRYPDSRSSISIGGIYSRASRSFQELYKLADSVLYEVKQLNKGQCIIREIDL